MIVSTFKVFLVGFDPSKLKRESLTAFFDVHDAIHNWMGFFPGQIFIVSDQSANYVSVIIREQFTDAFVFVAHVTPLSCDGWLPEQVWNFINNPTSVKVPMHGFLVDPIFPQ